MAETDLHRDLMINTIESLKARYVDRRDVYVSGNNFIYFVEGDPGRRVSPDTYVVFGVPNRPRNSYRVWEEGGRQPDVVFEFTSRKTKREDVRTKGPLYEQVLRVPEYFQFDPTGDYLRPRLQGFRLAGDEYVALELVEQRLRSEVLGLELVWEGDNLRLWDPLTKEWLLTPAEQVRRAEQEARRAEQEARRAEQEARRAEQEATARRELERENERLRAELERLQRQAGA